MKMVFGILVFVLGAIFLSDNLGWLEAQDAFRLFWPLAFVAMGLTVLSQPRAGSPKRAWGVVWILAGAWIYAHQRDWIEVEFWDLFFPGVLLLFGGSLIWRALQGGRVPARRRASDEPGEYVRSFAVMAGNEIRSVAHGFRGADLGAFMGGVVLDLTQARIDGEEAIVDTFAVWGGIEIRVPPDWSVVSKVTPVIGAYEDKSRPTATESSKRLVVRGFVVMGGVEIKN